MYAKKECLAGRVRVVHEVSHQPGCACQIRSVVNHFVHQPLVRAPVRGNVCVCGCMTPVHPCWSRVWCAHPHAVRVHTISTHNERTCSQPSHVHTQARAHQASGGPCMHECTHLHVCTQTNLHAFAHMCTHAIMHTHTCKHTHPHPSMHTAALCPCLAQLFMKCCNPGRHA